MKTLEQQTKQAAFYIAILGMVFIALGTMEGCGTSTDSSYPVATASPTPSQSSMPDAVMSIVNDYNQWRIDNGQETIDPGLTCTLYTVPQTTTGITATANGGATPVLTNVGAFTYQGVFNQPNAAVGLGLNILPLGLQSVYQTWFIVKCTGYVVITTDDYHSFNTVSDDGSNLYVDGVLVVNNDGLHGAQSVTGERHLQDVVHSFELDFFQGGGQQELVVDMDGSLLPAEALWH